jgi:hypothetical protein
MNSYKNKFDKFGDNLDKRQVMHDQVVGEQHREKIRKQIDWETNGDHLYKQMAEKRVYDEQ